MKNFDKYVNENIKDFSEVRKLLEEDNIKKFLIKIIGILIIILNCY